MKRAQGTNALYLKSSKNMWFLPLPFLLPGRYLHIAMRNYSFAIIVQKKKEQLPVLLFAFGC